VTDEPAPRQPTEVAPEITVVDIGTGGFEAFNAVYLIAAREPALIETGPGADVPTLLAALDGIGVDPGELAHVVVTHIHVDHAGGAGEILRRFPGATLWVHERGAPHAADPTRLVASTARTYGESRMRELYGETLPCPSERIRAVDDGDVIGLGDRSLEVLHTPGHASHHVALLDTTSGSMFTGEAIGSHLPWADCYRPALPPPEVDVEAALASIGRMRERSPSRLLASHFGPIADPSEGFERGADRMNAWAETVRRRLVTEPEVRIDALVETLTDQAREEYEADAGEPFDLERYDAIGSIRMNAEGLTRYWRKRWERETGTPTPPIS
jgi:glyoxylase-like metal-dependent hydrolase (beta-lactamase superfamily II)